MLIDYHVHLEADSYLEEPPYALERLEAYLEAAAERGIAELGITEHCNRFKEFAPIMRRVESGPDLVPRVVEWLHRSCTGHLEEYVSLIESGKERGLPVKLGIEVDYIPGEEDRIREVLSPYPWDFILGSVHFLGCWAFDVSRDIGWPGRDVDRVIEDYFGVLKAAAQSNLFDVLAHPDLIKKFGHRPKKDIAPILDDVVESIAGLGLAVEVSSAGLRKPVGEIYPTQDFLRRCRRRGVPITLASDAHDETEVGMDVEKVVAWAREAGYDEIVTFDRRVSCLGRMG